MQQAALFWCPSSKSPSMSFAILPIGISSMAIPHDSLLEIFWLLQKSHPSSLMIIAFCPLPSFFALYLFHLQRLKLNIQKYWFSPGHWHFQRNPDCFIPSRLTTWLPLQNDVICVLGTLCTQFSIFTVSAVTQRIIQRCHVRASSNIIRNRSRHTRLSITTALYHNAFGNQLPLNNITYTRKAKEHTQNGGDRSYHQAKWCFLM